MGRWPTRLTLRSIPIAVHGILPKRRPASTRTSPPSWSVQPDALSARRAGGSGSLPGKSRRPDARALAPGEPRLAAAHAMHQAGAFDPALRLIAIAESGPLNELQRAQVELLRAQIAFALNLGNDVPPLLLEAAKRLEPLDPRLARETYLEALTAVLFPAHLAPSGRVLETAQAARAAPLPASSQPFRGSDLLLDGLALLITDGYAAGTPTLKRGVNAFRGEDMDRAEGRRWLWLASRVAAFLWDDEAWEVISARFVQLARDAGALSALPLALTTRTGMHLFDGGARHCRFAGR